MAQSNGARQRPAETISYGRLRAAIWKQESDKGPWYNVTIARSYRDQAGNWQSSASYGRDDLLLVAKLADHAHSRICQLMARDASGGGNGEVSEGEDGVGYETSEPVPF